jgi:hypothetical protein
MDEYSDTCHCDDCASHRLAILIRKTKAELLEKYGPPEWDWEDLARQSREYRERVKQDPIRGGFRSK